MPHTVLLIEDEETLMDMYRLRFEKDGYTLLAANRGAKGLVLAKREQPDLILLDIVMPEMDGYQVLEKLKGDPATQNLRVIVLSNLGQEEEITRARELGAEDFFIKSSLTPSGLVEKVTAKLGPNLGGQAAPPAGGARARGRARRAVVAHDLGTQLLTDVRVLLIEDNEIITEMYSLRLQKEGAVVTVTHNGPWGVRQAESGECDVILLDVMMPGFNGIEALQRLKKNPKTATVPVLVLSNSAQDEERAAALAGGAAGYMVKADLTPAGLIREVVRLWKLAHGHEG